MSSPVVQPPWSSDFEGWYTRTRAHPAPDSFVPARSDLVQIVLRNSQVEHEGFTLAIFKDKVAVDAMGKVLVVSDRDFDGISKLTTRVLELPDTGNFRNTWRLKHLATSQPIDRILIGEELRETSVQGFVKGLKELKDDAGVLPDELAELAGLVLEARGNFERGQEDKEMIQKLKDIVADRL
ncbi:hypothetical protein C8J56DRAFT_799229 [Mycena floridula]|nr:hypothetical protein C8J56DRAFT_799229 [Mycena floridula]